MSNRRAKGMPLRVIAERAKNHFTVNDLVRSSFECSVIEPETIVSDLFESDVNLC